MLTLMPCKGCLCLREFRYLKQFAKLRVELTDKLFNIYNSEVFKNKVNE